MEFFMSVMAWFGILFALVGVASTIVGYIKEKKKKKEDIKKE